MLNTQASHGQSSSFHVPINQMPDFIYLYIMEVINL